MKVILLEDINNLGQAGEIVEVKRGYANNYLLRQNLAVRTTKENLNTLKLSKKPLKQRRARNLADAQEKLKKSKVKNLQLKSEPEKLVAYSDRLPRLIVRSFS